jgi:catechol 2,3-dioxygenase-like lactoylglutathione lyase family enzyme
MLKRLTHVNLWVRDQDEALAFYTRQVGFELRDDVTLPEFGRYRFLTVGPPLQPEVRFVLGVPGVPVHDPDTAAKITELVAKGAMSGLNFEVDDCGASFAELTARGVEFIQEPNRVPWGVDAAFRDPSGNHIRIVQPIPPAGNDPGARQA